MSYAQRWGDNMRVCRRYVNLNRRADMLGHTQEVHKPPQIYSLNTPLSSVSVICYTDILNSAIRAMHDEVYR